MTKLADLINKIKKGYNNKNKSMEQLRRNFKFAFLIPQVMLLIHADRSVAFYTVQRHRAQQLKVSRGHPSRRQPGPQHCMAHK